MDVQNIRLACLLQLNLAMPLMQIKGYQRPFKPPKPPILPYYMQCKNITFLFKKVTYEWSCYGILSKEIIKLSSTTWA